MKLFHRCEDRTDSGFSLVEILVTVGLISVVAGGIMALQASDLKRMTANRQMVTRDALKALADRYLLDSNVIANSAKSANYSHITGNSSGNEALD